MNRDLVVELIKAVIYRSKDMADAAFRAARDKDRDAAIARCQQAFLDDPDAYLWARCELRPLEYVQALRDYYKRRTRQQPSAARDDRKSRLCKLTFRLMRSGAGAKQITHDVRRANADLSNPLPERDLRGLILWCAERHQEECVGVGR